jgi:hypothetical protein
MVGLLLGLGLSIGSPATGAAPVPENALTFSDNTPLQFSDGTYLEFAA